ncbi:MAG: hypothetical protein H7096_08185 [Flavobacterium sp.]|nr:hypothetical protein [Pedobacter sp.]
MEQSFDTMLTPVATYPMHALIKEEAKDQNQMVSLEPLRILKFFATIIVTLFTISFLFILVQTYFGIESKGFDKLHRLFNLNKESNIPTLFSSVQLLIASIILFYLYTIDVVKRGYWLFLSIVFLMLCIDETAQIHELLNGLKTRVEILNQSSLLHVWVYPYLLLVIFLGVILSKFIFQLPFKTRNLLILSGVIFVGGAVGMEMLQEQVKIFYGGAESLLEKFLYCLEETCEMAGVAIFNYSLIGLIETKKISLKIKLQK